ncbi:hypothetical protein BV349_04862 [Pseudomonas syringae pv. actinidiae]|uniref:Cobalamin biosynthesis protein CobN n=1 Tax=Pseudomonas syringae pv. actinidiae TaxID=103796 RepID=A0A2V0QR04_PSESF|nr:hypothetical protein BV349_04862 [Pseudomonas syringae pv. actinidiae]GBH11692.1 Cobalamin biosynthesis protein CobN [Pseudomonas syringae pv. actinidiae]
MQNPGSVSGPTSSGSFALTLIRGSLQRAIPGPVQIALKKRFLSTIVRRSASHAVLDALRPLCGASCHTTVLRCR